MNTANGETAAKTKAVTDAKGVYDTEFAKIAAKKKTYDDKNAAEVIKADDKVLAKYKTALYGT